MCPGDLARPQPDPADAGEPVPQQVDRPQVHHRLEQRGHLLLRPDQPADLVCLADEPIAERAGQPTDHGAEPFKHVNPE
jgi:hypothetical protein